MLCNSEQMTQRYSQLSNAQLQASQVERQVCNLSAFTCPWLHMNAIFTNFYTSRVGAETLLKVYGVKVDPEEFAAFAGMGEVG